MITVITANANSPALIYAILFKIGLEVNVLIYAQRTLSYKNKANNSTGPASASAYSASDLERASAKGPPTVVNTAVRNTRTT